MNAEKLIRPFLISVLTVGLVLPALAAEASAPAAETPKLALGTIVGIVRSAAKAPVGGATVTAARSDGGSIRATVSGSDGLYSFADMAPGAWSVTLQADGYADTV